MIHLSVAIILVPMLSFFSWCPHECGCFPKEYKICYFKEEINEKYPNSFSDDYIENYYNHYQLDQINYLTDKVNHFDNNIDF